MLQENYTNDEEFEKSSEHISLR